MMPANRRHIGRVIFDSDGVEWLVLTLACHVNNVTYLVKLWDATRAYLSANRLDLTSTCSQLIRAAEIHDSAKPRKFHLRYREHPFRTNTWRWEYSFAGHRFEVFDSDPYVQALARLHHEYSIDGIAKAMAELRAMGVSYANHLPLDLYTLEMCDQIEATVARSALGGEPEARVFMDFHIERVEPSRFRLDPFPFNQNEVLLTLEYAGLHPASELVQRAKTGNEAERQKVAQQLTVWLEDKLQTSDLETMEVSLCPLAAA